MMKVRTRKEVGDREDAEQAATQNSIHVFQQEKLNYIFLSLSPEGGERRGIITESVRRNPESAAHYVIAHHVHYKAIPPTPLDPIFVLTNPFFSVLIRCVSSSDVMARRARFEPLNFCN
jgi:hypothetical protein